MNKTIFNVDDIYNVRTEREREYAVLTPEEAKKLRRHRADTEWNEIMKLRGIYNSMHKCPNKLKPQRDILPEPIVRT